MLVTNVRISVQVGDFVGWADTWSDEWGCTPAGLVLETRNFTPKLGEKYTEFLILDQSHGQMSWEFGSDLVVMFESQVTLEKIK